MAANDIIIFDSATYVPGTKRFVVKGQGRAAGIKVGELVRKSLGAAFVTAWSPGMAATALAPELTTDVLAGLAMSTSTETTTADGVVDVMPIVPGMTYLIDAYSPSTYGTSSTPVQATYDALVGDRVLLNYAATTGKFTILSTDGSYNGCVVEPLDVVKHPGKVRFSLRQGLSYTS
jgi:hypothetical protein